MMGRSHRILGALAGAAYAVGQGQPRSVVAMTALVATATSNGPTSPDGDQTGQWWPALTALAPTWVHRHRGLLHWWGLPVLAWLAVPALDPQVQWAAHALLVGWASHIIGDAVFGRVPLLPWGCNWGLRFDTDGPLESGVRIFRWRTPSALRVVLLTALAYVLTVGTGLDLPGLVDRIGGV
jgi:membrane-bound metal-dependent hydrolase YbcI (DUF457 family)